MSENDKNGINLGLPIRGREYWIHDIKGEQLRATYTMSYDPGAVHVIEYSAFEKMRDERDLHKSGYTLLHDAKESLRLERDKLQADLDQQDDLLNEKTTALVEAGEEIKRLQDEVNKLRTALKIIEIESSHATTKRLGNIAQDALQEDE